VDDFDVLPNVDDSAFPYLSDSRLLEGRAEKLLAGDLPDENPADGVRELGALLSAMRAPARPQEIDGQARAVAAFAAFSAAKEKAAAQEKTFAKEKAALKEKSNVRRLPTHFGPKVSAATAVALLAFTGVAAAAVTGSLPARLQSFVHARIGAISGPTTEQSHTGSTSTGATQPPSPSKVAPMTGPSAVPGVGPSVDGTSTAGLCQAFDRAKSTSAGAADSIAARNVQAAAAAAGQTVDAYCAPALSGGKTAAPEPSTGQHGHGPGTGSGGKTDSSGNSGGDRKP
jgi:hypothetical protein